MMLLPPLNEIRGQESINALKALGGRTWFLRLRWFFHKENIRLNYTLDKSVLALHTLLVSLNYTKIACEMGHREYS
jgi:hypothetical protein